MIKTLNIDNTEILLENFDINQGKITIKNYTYGEYSSYWGAMGGTLEEFICRINDDYFCNNLLGSRSMYTFCPKKTFASVRRYIRTEMDLPWYKHQDFQKKLRESLNVFQESCEECPSDRYFVDMFSYYLKTRLNFYLINDRFEKKLIEDSFDSLCSEPWYFIEEKETETSIWLKKLHKKIKKQLC